MGARRERNTRLRECQGGVHCGSGGSRAATTWAELKIDRCRMNGRRRKVLYRHILEAKRRGRERLVVRHGHVVHLEMAITIRKGHNCEGRPKAGDGLNAVEPEKHPHLG